MIEFSIVVLFCLTGYLGGWIFTEHSQLAIIDRFSQLNRKPFNCRPCLTFHLIWIQHGMVAVYLQSFALFVAGLICAFGVFVVLYIDNNNKIEK